MRILLASLAVLVMLMGCSHQAVRLQAEQPTAQFEQPDSPQRPADRESAHSEGSYHDRARQLCEGSGRGLAEQYGASVQLLASHPTTELRFEAWADSRRDPKAPRPTPSEPPGGSRFVALCYFDGAFNEIPKGPPPGIEPADYRRISVLAFEDGEARLFAAAPTGTISPSQAPAPPAGG